MNTKFLHTRADLSANTKALKNYTEMQALISELQKHNLDDGVVNIVNSNIETINNIPEGSSVLASHIKRVTKQIITHVEKTAKLTPINHYRNVWMSIGMAAFGIPLGVAFGSSIGNMGMMAVGIPIGLAVGLAIGTSKDKQAKESGHQLNIEIGY